MLSAVLAVVRFVLYLLTVCVFTAAALLLVVALAATLLYPELPQLDSVTYYHPAVPLRVYTADATLIGEFGAEHRALVRIQDIPRQLKLAILAAEDSRFYEHGAIDLRGVLRSAYIDTVGGAARQGASTITMQLARNLFLSHEKTLVRKFAEALLAYKIENSLSKDGILERYVNQIYLGNRAYGFAAAAEVYFNKPLAELTLAQEATLAGLPRGPSRYNPRTHPKAAAQRRAYVLGRMRELGYVDAAQYAAALRESVVTVSAGPHYAVDAEYAAEEARRMMFAQYGEGAYADGYSVYTTLRDADQAAADAAVRGGVLAYDRRHGYRGGEGGIALNGDKSEVLRAAMNALRGLPDVNALEAAVVLRADGASLEAVLRDGRIVHVRQEGLKFAGKTAAPKPGTLIRVQRDGGQWVLAQLPQAQAALVALDPGDGAVLALCGGFDFDSDQFDHATQAYRQPGSSFKPFVYSAALEKGYSPSTLVQDAPLVIPASYPGGPSWAPHNYEDDFLGEITLRQALSESRNVPAARVLQAIGVPYARDYVTRFGFPASQIPPYPTMVLGVGSFTPLQMAAAYAVFANGGFRVQPYLIERVSGPDGKTLYAADPRHAGQDAPRTIDPRNAFLMTNLLEDVARRGTAAAARSLGRKDLAGKTGTTEDFVDAWFDGFNPDQVAVSWIGFDQPHSLGRGETGAHAALPMWEDYMRVALRNAPEQGYSMPAGVVEASIGAQYAPPAKPRVWPDATDYFYVENAPSTAGESPGVEDEAMPASGASSH